MKNSLNTQTKAAIVFDDVRFRYERKDEKGAPNVIDHFSLTIPQGSRCVLFGPSGAGKSTILKLICHLQKPESGSVQNNCSRISMAFQKDRLFDGLSVLDNIRYGLPRGSLPEKERTKRAVLMAQTFQCADLLDRRTSTLSGGQRQRAALARAFMKKPDLLLMDESFQGFDAVLREQLIGTILSLQAKERFTLVLITHSFEEAMRMGDYLVLIEEGRMQAQGKIWELAQNPKDLFSAGALGCLPMNLLPPSAFKSLKKRMPENTAWFGFYPWQAEVVETKKPGKSEQPKKSEQMEKQEEKQQKPEETLKHSNDETFIPAAFNGAIPLGLQDLLLFSFDGYQAEVAARSGVFGEKREAAGFRLLQICCFDKEGRRIDEIDLRKDPSQRA